jgi:hypothetical protein
MEKSQRLSRSLADLLFTLPFLLLFLVQLAHHQMWRDEINVFAIGQVSPTFGSLLYHVHYEGHPWLWYTLVWLLTRVTASPDSLKLLAAISGVTTYLLIGVASPFRRVEKLLLFVNYFILFEYTVFARMYGLELAFLLLFLWHRTRRPQSVLVNSLLLGLAASLDMTGLILAFALACEYLWSLLRKPLRPPVPPVRIAAGALVLLALTALSVFTLYPTPDLSRDPHGLAIDKNPYLLLAALMDYVARPYLPTLRDLTSSFWNPKFDSTVLLLLVAVPLVLAAYWSTFRRRGSMLFILGTTLVLSMAFGIRFYIGFTRHFGVTFVAFLACLWMLRAQGGSLHWPAYALLACAALAGIDADLQSWRVPFSNARVTADYLEDKRLMSLPWAGFEDFSVATLSTYTGHPIFQLNCLCTESFFFLARQRDVFHAPYMAEGIERAALTFHAPEFLYIGDAPLKPKELQALAAKGMEIQPLRSFTGAAEPLEDFYIYDVHSPEVAEVAGARPMH